LTVSRYCTSLSPVSNANTTARNWHGSTVSAAPLAYVNNTGANLDAYHAAIMAATKADGALCEELADLLVLSKPAGVWLVNWA